MSWVVSHKYKFIFVHIPKTGGTSISGPKSIWKRAALFRYLGKEDVRPGGHRSIRRLGISHPVERRDYFKFAFMREPFERVASLYYSIARHDENKDLRFDEFVKTLPLLNKFMAFARSQTWWIKNEDGSIGVDWLGDFANISEDFEGLCPKIGLPPIRLPKLNSSGRIEYQELYNDESRKVVRELFVEDFELYLNVKNRRENTL